MGWRFRVKDTVPKPSHSRRTTRLHVKIDAMKRTKTQNLRCRCFMVDLSFVHHRVRKRIRFAMPGTPLRDLRAREDADAAEGGAAGVGDENEAGEEETML